MRWSRTVCDLLIALSIMLCACQDDAQQGSMADDSLETPSDVGPPRDVTSTDIMETSDASPSDERVIAGDAIIGIRQSGEEHRLTVEATFIGDTVQVVGHGDGYTLEMSAEHAHRDTTWTPSTMDSDPHLMIRLTQPNGQTLTKDDTLLTSWRPRLSGFLGYAYFDDFDATIRIGSTTPVVYRCETHFGSRSCRETTVLAFEYREDAMRTRCENSDGTFAEQPCDRTEAVSECIHVGGDITVDYQDACLMGIDALKDNCLFFFGSGVTFNELNGGCP